MGRKRGRYVDKERSSRRHSEVGHAGESPRGYGSKRGYSATVEKLTAALDTAIQALKPKASTRSRSRSNHRFRRSD